MTEALNEPPYVGPFPPQDDVVSNPAPELVQAALGSVAGSVPMIDRAYDEYVDLPGGYLLASGVAITTARVRELNGYDEERLSRISANKNVAVWVTELLSLAVEDLGGEKPSKDQIRSLLIGDRDALLLGVRKATYGPDIEFPLHCDACEADSIIGVNLDDDVEVIKLDEPTVRQFEVQLRHGFAKVGLIDGFAQESFSENIAKKTVSELSTILLSKSVIEINGVPTMGSEDAIRALSVLDRETLNTFVATHQPGPQMNKEIRVSCATCGAEYPILLGLANLFRF